MQWQKLTTMFLIFLIGGILTGCGGIPTLPAIKAELIEATATDPAPDCDWPEFAKEKRGEDDYYYLDDLGLGQLFLCREIARDNRTIALENAAALRAAKDEINARIAEMRDRHDLANYAIEDSDHRRREAVIEAWAAKGLLMIAVIAAL